MRPLPPTPLDSTQQLPPRFRAVRSDRNELRHSYDLELDNLDRTRTVGLVEGREERELGLLRPLVEWEHLRAQNCIRSTGTPRWGADAEYEIPSGDEGRVRRAMRRVVLTIRVANALNAALELGTAVLLGAILLHVVTAL